MSPNPTSSVRREPEHGAIAGIALMALAMLLIPSGDAIGKYLMRETPYSAEFLAWSRFVLGSCTLVPLVALNGQFRGLGARFFLQQFVRAMLVCGAITFVLTGARTISLADAYGAFFIGPALATVLAVVLLRERVGWFEWTTVILGFIGVMLVLRPSADIQIGLLWALAGGCCYGSFLVATRWAAGSGPPVAQLAAQLFFGMLVLAPFGADDYFQHGLLESGWLLLMGVASGLANLLAIMALSRARAAYLAPIVYLQIVSAVTLSWVIFADVPDALALLGLVVILMAGILRFPWRRSG